MFSRGWPEGIRSQECYFAVRAPKPFITDNTGPASAAARGNAIVETRETKRPKRLLHARAYNAGLNRATG